jgi:predicted transcriptional regulator
MRKQRVHIRLTDKVIDQLEQFSNAPGVTKSAIVEDALAVYFDPSRQESREAALMRRMDGFDLRQSAIERDTALIVETLGQYILYWLTRTEPLPDGERDVAHNLGQKRFDYFIGQVAQKLGSDTALSTRLFPMAE